MNERFTSSSLTISSIRTIAEDELYRAINKPSGVHSASLSAEDQSVATWVHHNFPEHSSVGGPSDGGLTHRLDRETSGVLIAARSQESWLHLRNLFSTKQVIKWYIAICEGCIGSPTTCSAPIAARYRHSKTVTPLSPVQEADPRHRRRFHSIQPASSTFYPLARLAPEGPSLVAVLIDTGRRHQIRAHAASLGHPLAGDTRYGATTHPDVLAGRPFLLHCLGISFVGADEKRKTYLSLDTLPSAITTLVRQAWPAIENEAAHLFSLDDTSLNE